MVELELFNGVGDSDGITVDSVRTFLNANKNEDINFKISSLGGDLGQSITIHNLIKSHSGKTVANIVGLTASAGTVIAMACDDIIMNDNALFLIHNGWQQVTGNVYDLQQAASNLMKNDALMIKMYKDRTGLDDEKIRSLMKASDWLSPAEALEYGFVDRVVNSGAKIAASAIITEAQTAIKSEIIINKLKEKMKIFGKKEPNQVLNTLALKDGNQVLISAEVVTEGVEVAPLGAMTLEDGEYELADGKKIVVTGGVITEVKEMKAPDSGDETSAEQIVAAVSDIIVAEVAKVQAEVDRLKETMAKTGSTHTPVKGGGPVNIPSAKAPANTLSKVDEVVSGIRNKIVESRKA